MTDVKDVPISAEGLLALTWILNLIVFIFLFLRLMLNRRQGLKTPAIIISDVLVVASWIFGVASISTDAWKYNLEIEGRSRELAASELTIASKVQTPRLAFFFPSNLILANLTIPAFIPLRISSFYGDVACKGCLCSLLFSPIPKSFSKVQKIFVLRHSLHR